ncbi:MAG: AAA family ATPase [Halobacteriovoraceae bacterium]|nr:AAA family ATPase [Halobacteriovoraceae bacterium]
MSQRCELEVFCGTGGVGKTTLATSRAIHLASLGRRVLLITIDPARRLKQVLGLDLHKFGKIEEVNLTLENNQHITFDAELLNPKETLKRISGANDDVHSNPILDILLRPYGGLNEIMSVLEVQFHLEQNNYETIVLDTPPGQHFIDFVEAAKKIETFFDNSFLDFFAYLNKKIETNVRPPSFLKKIVSSGVKKLLGYLEIVTGKDFVELFVDTIYILNLNKEVFLTAKDFQLQLKNEEYNHWFVILSVEQSKVDSMQDLLSQFNEITKGKKTILINKSLKSTLDAINLDTISEIEKTLLNNFLTKENIALNSLDKHNIPVLKFGLISDQDPLNQAKELAVYWKSY